MIMEITRAFNSDQLILEEKNLELDEFEILDALALGDLAKELAIIKNLPIAIEVRIGNWIIYHASLPGSNPENQSWLDRKARVVLLKQHSTLYEKINSEERKINWYAENNVSEELYAIHGGGIPISSKKNKFLGCLLISGLPQIEDHIFGAEVIKKFRDKKLIYNGE